jgi:hypothetical protein
MVTVHLLDILLVMFQFSRVLRLSLDSKKKKHHYHLHCRIQDFQLLEKMIG